MRSRDFRRVKVRWTHRRPTTFDVRGTSLLALCTAPRIEDEELVVPAPDLDVVEASFPVLMNYADVLDEFARPPPAGFSSRELTHEEEMLLEKLARQIPTL